MLPGYRLRYDGSRCSQQKRVLMSNVDGEKNEAGNVDRTFYQLGRGVLTQPDKPDQKRFRRMTFTTKIGFETIAEVWLGLRKESWEYNRTRIYFYKDLVRDPWGGFFRLSEICR